MVTPDGRYLVFLRVSPEIDDVDWISARVIERLREQSVPDRSNVLLKPAADAPRILRSRFMFQSGKIRGNNNEPGV